MTYDFPAGKVDRSKHARARIITVEIYAMLDSSQLLVGFLIGAIQLGIGLMVGIWMGRRSGWSSQSGDAQLHQAREMVRSLSDLASSISADVGKYRARMERVSQELLETASAQSDPSPELVARVAQRLTFAMDRLQSRLQVAEQRLQEQTRQNDQFLTEARTDALTEIANRRALDEDLQRRLAQGQRDGTFLSLLLIDVDHFKQINDQHGHLHGDNVLKQIAGQLRRSVRQMDLLARFGGEEFAVVLPSTGTEDANRVAEKIRRAIAHHVFRSDNLELKVTISVGVAEADRQDTLTTLLQRADAALYTSKEAGRNCGHYHDGRRCLPIGTIAEKEISEEISAEMKLACDDLRKAIKATDETPVISEA